MSAIAVTVKREIDAAGTSIKGFNDASSRLVQAVCIDPEVGAGLLTPFNTADVGEVAILVNALARRVYMVDVNVDPGVAVDTWLMVFDKATAPVATDIPIIRAKVGGGIASIDRGFFGRELTNGLGVALSTTVHALTLAGANDAFFQGDWSA